MQCSVDECRVLSGVITNTSGRYEFLGTHETCADTTFISTAAECESAAAVVGLPWNSCCQSDPDTPYGCLRKHSSDSGTISGDTIDEVIWNGLSSSKTLFSSITDKTALCRVPEVTYTSDSNGTCVECKRCPAGYKCRGGLKVQCGAGTHSYGGQAACSPTDVDALKGHICANGLCTPCLGSTYADKGAV